MLDLVFFRVEYARPLPFSSVSYEGQEQMKKWFSFEILAEHGFLAGGRLPEHHPSDMAQQCERKYNDRRSQEGVAGDYNNHHRTTNAEKQHCGKAKNKKGPEISVT